jgi:hypothetical protein
MSIARAGCKKYKIIWNELSKQSGMRSNRCRQLYVKAAKHLFDLTEGWTVSPVQTACFTLGLRHHIPLPFFFGSLAGFNRSDCL